MKKEFHVVGKRQPKVEAIEKATGQLKYTSDIFFPKSLHAKILRSPHAHVNIKSIDISKAIKLKGVKDIITYKDVPKIPTMHQFLHLPEKLYYDSFLLESKVRHYGDRVAAVAAETAEIAEAALELIEVEYEQLPAVLDLMASDLPTAPAIHTKAWRGGNPIEIKNNILNVYYIYMETK